MTEQSFVILPQLTLQVVADDTGRSLHEIYVLFRPAPPPQQAKETGLLTYLSGLWTAEERPVPRPYQLGKTDECGYLQHAAGHAPQVLGPMVGPVESLKLAKDVAYEMYFVRHPDPAYADTVLRELNGQATVQRTQGWPAPGAFTPQVEMRTVMQEEQLTLRLPSTTSTYQPQGHSAYGGWVLYKGMPHADVQSVKDAVEKLQLDLGKLRYIIGSEPPYEPEGPARDKGVVVNTATINVGVFDARTMSAVLHFQRQVVAKQAYQVDKAKAHDKASGATANEASWAYATGTPVSPTPPAPEAHEAALKADGVCDAITARAIDAWKSAGYRRRGAIVVALQAMGYTGPGVKEWFTWLRPEAAEALLAWREIVKALGHTEGICASHTYRTPLTDVGHAAFGRSAVSIHKTGLALDLRHDGKTREPLAIFKVLIARDEVVPQTNRAKVHIGDRYYWRLFGGVKLAADVEQAAAAVRAALTPLSTAGGIKGEAALALLTELAAPPAFFAKYYRDEVQKWVYDAWDDQGGTPGDDVTAEAYRGAGYTRFLDLTKIGELCKLKRIGSFTNKLDPTGSDWGLAANTIKPDKIAKVKALGDGLVNAKSKVHDPVTVTIAGTAVPLADVQADFLVSYASALSAISSDAKGKLYGAITGAQLVVKLSWAKTAREGIEAVAAQLEGLSGELKAIDLANEVKSAADWAAWLRAKLDELDPLAPGKTTTGGSTATAKPPSKVTFHPVLARGAGTPLSAAPNVGVTYPAPGDPIGMEWWHFQRSDVVSSIRRFGALLLDLGWTDEGLLDTPSAVTYGRTGVGYPQSELDKTVG